MRKLLTTNYSLQTNKGFTLIELLLYVSIAAVLLLITSIFLSSLLQSRIKNQTIVEVEQQGAQVLHVITQAGRNADSVDEPAVGMSSNELELVIVNAAVNPTIVDLVSGVIRIKEGAGSPIALTNSRITASALTFQNLSRTSTPGTIRIQFTLTHVNPGGKNEYSFTKTFTGSATLRQP